MDQKVRILVVDNDETIRTVFRTILKAEGYDVETAANGVEAIEKSKVAFFNLALVDIRLSDMEGTKLLTAMKETVPRIEDHRNGSPRCTECNSSSQRRG